MNPLVGLFAHLLIFGHASAFLGGLGGIFPGFGGFIGGIGGIGGFGFGDFGFGGIGGYGGGYGGHGGYGNGGGYGSNGGYSTGNGYGNTNGGSYGNGGMGSNNGYGNNGGYGGNSNNGGSSSNGGYGGSNNNNGGYSNGMSNSYGSGYSNGMNNVNNNGYGNGGYSSNSNNNNGGYRGAQQYGMTSTTRTTTTQAPVRNKVAAVEKECRPDMDVPLDGVGICVALSDLDHRCALWESSISTRDCADVEGSFCCYKRASGKVNKIAEVVIADEPRPVFPTSTSTVRNPGIVMEGAPKQVIASTTTTLSPTPAPTTTAAAAPATQSPLNKPCNSVSDCPDSGTTCKNGRCGCWIEQGFSIAQTWQCDTDSGCEILFPGHVCRPTKVCPSASFGKLGYCIPRGALRE